jgi:N6-adenosine-specific RNA methylase IME4
MPPKPTRDDVDALVGPATPHFAYQIRARLQELVAGQPDDDEVRRYADERMELLERLAHASSKAEEGQREPATRPGWDEIPSSAPADDPLPHRA